MSTISGGEGGEGGDRVDAAVVERLKRHFPELRISKVEDEKGPGERIKKVRLLGDEKLEKVPALDVETARAAVEAGLEEDRVVALFTSRELVTGASDEENLAIGRRVSEALVKVVAGLASKPRFLIAKGGITSSDVATEALGIRRAMVLGQLLPGVPVWRAENGLGYVVFPGNVGDNGALLEAVSKLRA